MANWILLGACTRLGKFELFALVMGLEYVILFSWAVANVGGATHDTASPCRNQLHEVSHSGKMDMLIAKGINWNDYSSCFKRGSYIRRQKIKLPFTTEEIEKLPLKHNARKNPDLHVLRTMFRMLELPIFTKIKNREAVIFDDAEPLVEE